MVIRTLHNAAEVERGNWTNKTKLIPRIVLGEINESICTGIEVVVHKKFAKPQVHTIWCSQVDLLTAYRMMVLICQGFVDPTASDISMNEIEHAELHPHAADALRALYLCQLRYGPEAVDLMRTTMIPQDMVDIALQLQHEGLFQPLWRFREAVEMGLLHWSDTLAQLQVVHPEHYGEFEPLLRLYASNNNLHRHGREMCQVEELLDYAGDKADESYTPSDKFVFALSTATMVQAMQGWQRNEFDTQAQVYDSVQAIQSNSLIAANLFVMRGANWPAAIDRRVLSLQEAWQQRPEAPFSASDLSFVGKPRNPLID